jgi:hypothetical protein
VKASNALIRDGWTRDPASKDATITFIKRVGLYNKRIVIHYHADDVRGPKILKALLKSAYWETEQDLRRVGLIRWLKV